MQVTLARRLRASSRTSFVGVVFALVATAGLAAQADIWVSPTGDDTSGDGSSGNPYRTVSHAISLAAPSGDTIRLTAGTFGDDDQIELVSKSVAIVGAGRDSTFLHPHATLRFSLPAGGLPGTLQDHVVTLLVNGPGRLDVRDLTVDNVFRMPGTGRSHGLLVRNGGDAFVDNVEVTNVRSDPLTGAQGPVGVLVRGDDAGDPCVVTLRNCLVQEFGKNGITVGYNSVCVVDDCDVVGAGPIGLGLPAQNGIQFSYDATGAIRRCRISDIRYTEDSYAATGLLLYDFGPGIVIEGNEITGCEVGVYAYQSSITGVLPLAIRANTITESDYSTYVHNDGTTVTNNTLHGGLYQNASDDTDAPNTNVWSGNNYSDYSGSGSYAIEDGVLVDAAPRAGCDAFGSSTAVHHARVSVDIVALDLSGDGRCDFATADEGVTLASPPSLTVGLQDVGGGTYTTSTLAFGAAGAAPAAIVAGDFDGMPGIDLAIVTSGDNSLYVFVNDGLGTFSALPTYPLPASIITPGNLASADVDGTNGDDLVVSSLGGLGTAGGGFVLTNDGTGAAWTASALPGAFTAQCKGVAIGDIDGGVGADIALTEGNGSLGQVHLYTNNGSGTFSAVSGSPFSTGIDPTSVAIDDLDSDGDGDVLVTCTNAAIPFDPGTVTELRNDGATFALARTLRVGIAPQGVVCGDVSADSDPDTARRDAVVVNFGDGTLSALSSHEELGFGGNLVCQAGVTARACALADMNGDGLADLVVVDAAAQSVLVLSGTYTPRADLYGEGCGGASGRRPVIRPSGASAVARQPNLSFGVGLSNARPLSFGVLIASASPAASLNSCSLLLASIDVSIGVFTNVQGEANVSVPIISAPPNLIGGSIYFQYAVLDPDGEFLGLVSLTEGLAVRVGI